MNLDSIKQCTLEVDQPVWAQLLMRVLTESVRSKGVGAEDNRLIMDSGTLNRMGEVYGWTLLPMLQPAVGTNAGCSLALKSAKPGNAFDIPLKPEALVQPAYA